MKTGDWLPNGAIVLEVDGSVILAKKEGEPQPYVTWHWDQTDPASTTYGHYYEHIGAAAYDFEARVDRAKARRGM